MSKSAVLQLTRAKRPATPAEIQQEAERVRSKREVTEVAQGIAETVRLDEARGAEFIQPKQGRGERAKPVYRVSALKWMFNTRQITQQQYDAGKKYGDLYEKLYKGGVRSAIDFSVRGNPGLNKGEARTTDLNNLMSARGYGKEPGGLFQRSVLISVMDKLCGESIRPSEMVRLGYDSVGIKQACLTGLDLLAVHYGMA